MESQLDLVLVLRFLKGLRANNDRDWFTGHRAQFELARAHFEEYIDAVITSLSPTERLGGVTPRDCIFRLNRDLRFTKDKTPYKPYMSAYIAPGGRKSRRLGFYIHLEPGNRSMFGGGLHEPEPRQIAAWRAAIDRNPRPLLKIMKGGSFRRYFGELRGESLKTAPRGYAREHPNLALLRLKTVTVARSVSDKQVSSPQLFAETIATYRAMKPFLIYLGTLG